MTPIPQPLLDEVLKEFDEKFFDTEKGNLRMNTEIIDGQQYYKNVRTNDFKSFLKEKFAHAYSMGRQSMRNEILEKMPNEVEFPKTKCINAENHLFGSCFECEKVKGFNTCRDAVIKMIEGLRKEGV